MAAATQPGRVAIVGASSLRGKELKQLLEERSFPTDDIRLLDEEAVGTLTEAGGEAAIIQGIEEDSFGGARFAFFVGDRVFAEQHWGAAHRSGATVIDLSGALAAVPTAVPWIPALEAVLPPPQAPVGKLFWAPATATAIAISLCAALRGMPVARTAMIFFQPVSEREQAGINELEEQTVKLLSFQPFSQNVYDAQVAFNLLARYGESSSQRLEEARAALSRGVVRYLAGRAPVPAIQLIQAPVFYAAAFTAFVELSEPKPVEDLHQALVSAGITVGEKEGPPLGNVSVAGADRICVARVEPDSNVERGYWLWGAADNVRFGALNAVHIAEKLLGS